MISGKPGLIPAVAGVDLYCVVIRSGADNGELYVNDAEIGELSADDWCVVGADLGSVVKQLNALL